MRILITIKLIYTSKLYVYSKNFKEINFEGIAFEMAADEIKNLQRNNQMLVNISVKKKIKKIKGLLPSKAPKPISAKENNQTLVNVSVKSKE